GNVINVEVTEYHPENGRVGAEIRWIMFGQEYLLLAKDHDLKGVMIQIAFADDQLHITRDHKALAKQLVDCIECLIAKGWLHCGKWEVEFVQEVPHGREVPDGKFLLLSSRQWPILSQYLSMVIVELCPIDHVLPCGNHQTETAWCSADADHFMHILQSKGKKVEYAVRSGRFSRGQNELILLIVVDTQFDLASMASGYHELRSKLSENGFNFEASVFTSIWIMSEQSKEVPWRLHPQ